MISASGLGHVNPLATAWNGTGAWLIFSQSPQLNFSRAVSTTFHWRGTDPGGVFRACAGDATALTCRWRIDYHTLSGKMIGERIALGARAVNPRTVVVWQTAVSAAGSSSVALDWGSSNVGAN
jgi:hypothetical protein